MKFPTPTPEQIEAFAQRAISALPDSLAAQKADLVVLIDLLPRATHGHQTALAMFHALEMAERAQAEFCFPEVRPPRRDGHNGKDGAK